MLSVVSAYELLCGATSERQIEELDTLFSAVEPVPLTLPAVRSAGAEYVRLRGEGLVIGNQDLLLAGTALHTGCAVLTRNQEHFDRIPDLEVLTPEAVLADDSGVNDSGANASA